MKKLYIIILSVTLLCKQIDDGNTLKQSENNSTVKKETKLVLDTLCVAVKSGLRLRSLPNLNSEKLDLIPFKTSIQLFEYGEKVTIDNISSKWAKVNYLDKFGWVFSGYLNWNCQEYEEKDALNINQPNILGKYVDSIHGEEYFIEFKNDATFQMVIFGGCEDNGCFSEKDFGEWKLFNNLIYLKSRSNNNLITDVAIFYISIQDKGALYPIDNEHSIKENYGNDIISGWKKK
ncbi:SH3 domain-containing protein [Leptospira ognonensis]|uniref:SH3 domain-containing protein n=1 Tax=Leptospira ognonensis TaxID=2484945 RepID=A0A4R9KB48_9LEPT|nr:SH3 domain-containing protein [Leptospira ognonensis]TGL62033.1 SH3 domain-containing protein [Leptospira ognonensis]